MSIVFEDEFVTEHKDGTEEVRFTDEQWQEMLTDPKFGLVCRNGHRIDLPGKYSEAEGCLTCFSEMEAACDNEQYAAELAQNRSNT